MNTVEREMLDLLRRGADQYGFVAIKAEFEAEGTRPDEFLRLWELTHKAGLKVAIKIGGCEAVSDLLTSKLYGVNYVIAPMVETPYALTKYAGIVDKCYNADERQDTTFLFNLETEVTLGYLPQLVETCKAKHVDGFVFGRVDYTLSKGMPRDGINDEVITLDVLKVAEACRDADLELVVGGSVANEAIPALKRFREIRLDRFETRKVVFDGGAANDPKLEDGIQTAVKFETLWLKNKRDYYGQIAREDESRIAMMEKRIKG